MRLLRFKRSLLLISTGLLTLPTAWAQNKLEEITVTAERKETNLQTTPVVISAFTEAMLERMQAVEATELQNYVPGLTMVQGIAAPGKVDLYMRGAGDQVGAIILSESGVGVYIDDVFMPRLSVANIELLELERVEVLRGPQGTLYGRNSMGGAIRYITKTPDGGRGGNLAAGIGSFGSYNLRGHWQAPVIADKLAGSFTGSYRETGDWYDNITLDEERGNREVLAVNGKLAWIGDGPWNAVLSLAYSEEQNDGGEFVARDADTLDSITGDFRDVQSPLDAFGDNEQTRISLDASYDLNDQMTLRSITAFQDIVEASSFDLTGQGLFNRVLDSDVQILTQELQLRGVALNDKFDWLLGAFYFQEQGYQTVTDTIFFNELSPTVIDVETTSYAFYAEGTYRFDDRWALTAGLRYSDDEKDLRGAHRGVPVPAPGNVINASDSVTTRVVLDYQWTDNVFAFASISKGYKAGSFNALALSVDDLIAGFDPETVWAYEVGVKADILDSRLRTNVNVFFNDFSDLQGLNTTPAGLTTISNVADADVYGIELEYTYLATDRIELFGSIARQWDDYTNVDPTSNILPSFRINRASDWFAAIGAEYRLPVGDSGAEFGINGNLTYRSEYFNDIVNSPIVRTDDHTLLDVGAYYETANGDWRFTLSGKNVLDEEVYLKGLPLIRNTGQPNLPPIWTLSARRNF